MSRTGIEAIRAWLELNALVSSGSISAVFDRVPHLKCEVFTAHSGVVAPGVLRRVPHGLHRYALKHLVAYYVKEADEETRVYLVSSSEEPISNLVEEFNKRKIPLGGERVLSEQEVWRFVQEYKHVLADSYLRLALRGYLLQRGYSTRHVGRRTLWSRGDSNYLYVVDVDVDPTTLEGYISVDFRMHSSSSVWDGVIDGTLSEEALQGLIDSLVLVPYGRGYAYGRIVGFLEKKVSEDIEVEGGKINLLRYYAERKGVSIDPNEHPVVVVKLVSPGQDKPLHYPPSQVRLLISARKPEPHTRYEEIKGVLKDISSGFKPFGIAFKPAPVRGKGRVDMINDVKLKYYNDFVSHKSPLVSVQRNNAAPLRGRVDIPVLIVLLPRKLYERLSEVSATVKLVQELYKAYNMGEIRSTRIEYYDEKPSMDEQKVELSKAIGRLTNTYSPVEAIIVPVISHRDFFSVVKQRCSERYFHARVVNEDTLVKILDDVAECLLKGARGDVGKPIKELVGRLRRGVYTEEEKRLVSKLSNIVFSIYIEFVIQSEVFNRRIPHTLTWSLAEPADGEGRTLYLGYDVSRSPQSGGEVAAMFLLYDSYGNMVNATVKRYPGERISRDFLENVLLSLIAHGVKEQHVDRLVIYKDGFVRGVDEARELSGALQSIGTRTGFREFDVVGVVKRHNLRLFHEEVVGTGRESLRIANPERGTWVKLWSVSRFGVTAERALVVSSKARAGGTVKPVVIEHYDISRSGKGIDNIVSEYLRLCRLDFWNPIDGINKYPLPVFMADKLAYLSLIGVDIKTP